MAKQEDPKGELAIRTLAMPADAVIRDVPAFQTAVRAGMSLAESGYLVTFGVVPNAPETGYGYIRCPAAASGSSGCFDVTAFVEKPDTPTAEQYLKEGGYFWNSGIFLFRASAFLAELEQWQPEMAAHCRQAVDGGRIDLEFIRLDAPPFEAINADSIDYAVMEKTENAQMVAVDMGWSDVGSWDALHAISACDAAGNVCRGDTVAIETQNCLVRADSGKRIALVGVSDLIVVASGDDILVLPRGRSQEVKKLIEAMKK